MNNIDLQYISAKKVSSLLACGVVEFVRNEIEDELLKIEGYIEKYNNYVDKQRGVSVVDLINAREEVYKLLSRLEEYEKSNNVK